MIERISADGNRGYLFSVGRLRACRATIGWERTEWRDKRATYFASMLAALWPARASDL